MQATPIGQPSHPQLWHAVTVALSGPVRQLASTAPATTNMDPAQPLSSGNEKLSVWPDGSNSACRLLRLNVPPTQTPFCSPAGAVKLNTY